MSNQYERFIIRKPRWSTSCLIMTLARLSLIPFSWVRNWFPKPRRGHFTCSSRRLPRNSKIWPSGTDRATPHKHAFDEMYLMIGEEKAITFEVMMGNENLPGRDTGGRLYTQGTPHAIRPVDATVGKSGGANSRLPERRIHHSAH